ncbi:MAG: bifunctional oligoribonuclease/PAP phosphatase NrnA [Planctomycetes bacterium]|nr:bifunctional oligoribonuclease/PAP phosphatase NrnA [Planctomycetota bacterium]
MTPDPTAPDEEQERALSVLRSERSFLLVGHVRPDGDVIGAQGALARGLQALGKEVRILNADPPPAVFDYLTRELPYAVYGGGPLPAHDVVVLLDFNELSRTGSMAAPLASAGSKKLVIDHHPYEGRPWWDACYVDVRAAATGLLVRRILRALGAPLDRVGAMAVFTSLVTDTGWFRYSNTDAETLSLAGELVSLGVEPATLFGALYQRRPVGEPRALGAVLARLEYFAGGRLAIAHQPLGNGGEAPLEDADPLLDLVRGVGPVEVVLYLREVEPGVCKLSARSKTEFDVNRLARRFGGGGHVKAAGATLHGPLGALREQLLQATLEQLERGAGGGEPAR